MPPVASHPVSTDLSEQEIQARLTAAWVGIWMSVIVCLGAELYALVTWNTGQNRELLLLVTTLGLVTSPLLASLPLERIIRSRYREVFFLIWTAADIAMISVSAALDGGTQSPFVLVLVLPFLYGALSYPLWATAVTGIVSVGAFVTIAFSAGDDFGYSAFGAFSLLCVALLGSWEARNQSTRRRQLTKAAEALAASEEATRLGAEQQREVARYGRMALEGARIEDLESEAVDIVRRTLGVDVVLVVKHEIEGLRIVAHHGMDAVVDAGLKLKSEIDFPGGYALAAGQPVVIPDWEAEKRFKQSPAMAALNMRSGAMVPVRATGEPWGLIGLQSKELREYSTEDLSFLQAVAHVLANAIERSEAEQQTRHDALHDPLTGLPNRNLFLDRLQHALARSRDTESSVAVLFLDLDQFKIVNDSLGHAAGDELLAAVAPRLEQAVRPSDTVARFGGDEFAVLAEDVMNERDAIRVAERIAEALTRPFVLRKREHFASASIGIAIGAGAEEPGEVIRDADAALYRAKEHGRGGYEIFDDVMRSRVIDHMQTENDLRRALQREELELHFQPIVRLADDAVVFNEALLRWDHPTRGLLPPAAFIPVAEESRLIVPVGRWAIEEACRQAAAWQDRHPDAPPVGVSVNLSALQVTDPTLVHAVRSVLGSTGLEATTLRLELTETTLMEEAEAPREVLAALRELGVRLILDDFGTGFSSLGYLKRLPLSGIKLDRSFVENLTEGGQDAAIVRAVTEMAMSLGLDVCAEGVETAEQLEAVRDLGCSHAQGFHLGRPKPADKLATLASEGVSR